MGNPEELWSAFETSIRDVAGGCLGTHRWVKKKNFSQGTRDTIDLSRRARLNGRAELFRKLRRKTVFALRVDKEVYGRVICEKVEHHLWSSDSHPAYRGICALRSSKPVHRCTKVRVEGGRLLTEAPEVKVHWAGFWGGWIPERVDSGEGGFWGRCWRDQAALHHLGVSRSLT